jgi:hypothetical protein
VCFPLSSFVFSCCGYGIWPRCSTAFCLGIMLPVANSAPLFQERLSGAVRPEETN